MVYSASSYWRYREVLRYRGYWRYWESETFSWWNCRSSVLFIRSLETAFLILDGNCFFIAPNRWLSAEWEMPCCLWSKCCSWSSSSYDESDIVLLFGDCNGWWYGTEFGRRSALYLINALRVPLPQLTQLHFRAKSNVFEACAEESKAKLVPSTDSLTVSFITVCYGDIKGTNWCQRTRSDCK